MSDTADVIGAAHEVVRAWERVGRCEDEFGTDSPYCGEWRESLDTAIVLLRRQLGYEDVWVALSPAAGDTNQEVGQ